MQIWLQYNMQVSDVCLHAWSWGLAKCSAPLGFCMLVMGSCKILWSLGVCMHEVLQSVSFLWCLKDLLLFQHLCSQMPCTSSRCNVPVVSGVCVSSVYNSVDVLFETRTVSTNSTRTCRRTSDSCQYQRHCRQSDAQINAKDTTDNRGTRQTRDHAELRGT